MADDEADFAVKEYGGVGPDTQDIGSRTAVTSGTKYLSSVLCAFLLNLQFVIFILAAYHDC
ncbi:hypothetical protein AABM17_1340 [Neisseria musculi]|uniref:Uncharacterized protein n=1 Tax=Neisseria musculi TaxID=1815583 RepID=A0A7H1MDL0_9NEIS|nr:hypothetical protein H7A79_1340 [Neisseria musculi]